MEGALQVLKGGDIAYGIMIQWQYNPRHSVCQFPDWTPGPVVWTYAIRAVAASNRSIIRSSTTRSLQMSICLIVAILLSK